MGFYIIAPYIMYIVPEPGGLYLPRNETSYDPMHFDLVCVQLDALQVVCIYDNILTDYSRSANL